MNTVIAHNPKLRSLVNKRLNFLGCQCCNIILCLRAMVLYTSLLSIISAQAVPVLLLGLMANPAVSAVTNPSIEIHGRTPTATGSVSILMPDGTSALADNAIVSGTKKPNDFTLAPLSLGVVFSDEDGDTKGTPGLAIAPSGVAWTWKGPAGIPLTATQLAQAFATNFVHNAVLTVQANVLVISTSQTGIPTTSGIPIPFATPIYRIKINIPPPPSLRVNGHTFKWNSGFPTMGFVGATFQFYMNGVNTAANNDYTYSKNQPWVTTLADGTVRFDGTATPGNNSVRIIATNKSDSQDKHTLDITLGQWFVNADSIKLTAAATDSYCSGLEGGYSAPMRANLTNGEYNRYPERASTAGLWNQWGAMGAYGQGWIDGQNYWTVEPYGTQRYRVLLHTGFLYSSWASDRLLAVCSRAL